MPSALELVAACKRFGNVVAVDNVSITVRPGEFLTLLGPSGSGKTTIQRLVGGFETLDKGSIRIMDQRVDGLPPYKRDTATVFQSGALLPHKTVAENIAYGLRMKGIASGAIVEKVKRVLSIVRLDGFQDRYPNQLSGGQKQRVALARSIVVEPAILMFDESLSALDYNLRVQLRGEIKKLHDELGFTAIYVTHDQSEAMAMSDRVAVMNRGRLEQVGPPQEIFSRPTNEFIYSFVGEFICIPVTRDDDELLGLDGRALELKLESSLPLGHSRIYLRPGRISLGEQAKQQPNRLVAPISFVEYLGEKYRCHLEVPNGALFVDAKNKITFESGDAICVGWATEDMTIFK